MGRLDDARVLLIGQPNVGKSVIMNALTGARAIISNYPGTTVELTTGNMSYPGGQLTVVDTPGTYTLHSDSEEQRVTQRMLMRGQTDIIVNVVDAANLARNLYLTLQLLDFKMPMIVALNQMDRARSVGMEIDVPALEQILGVPVIPLSAVQGIGIDELRSAIAGQADSRQVTGHGMVFSPRVEASINDLVMELRRISTHENLRKTGHPDRALAIHLLEHDTVDEALTAEFPGLGAAVESYQHRMNERRLNGGAAGRGAAGGGTPVAGAENEPSTDEPGRCHDCYRDCQHCPAYAGDHPLLLTCVERTREARRIATDVVRLRHRSSRHLAERVEHLVDQPATGIPILIATAFASFRLVTFAVSYFEDLVSLLSPHLSRLIEAALRPLPSGAAHTLTDAITEGLLLPLEVVLPAMLSVNLLIALLEDSGLMSRFSVASDRLMSAFSLPGHAVIPIVLGFGCRAPAVLATRMLPDRRQRFIAMTLLGITIPCAASLGLIAGIVVQLKANALVIALSIFAVFLVLGALLGRYLPGTRQDLVIEVPPLRIPSVKNVAMKTWMRSHGFLGHVLPILLLTSIGVRLLIDSGALVGLKALSPLTLPLFGIPGEVFAAVVATAVQRYLAPAVLLSLPLSAREATIACSMVSLSYPCMPVSVLIMREMGWKSLAGVLAMATFVPLLVGMTLNMILP